MASFPSSSYYGSQPGGFGGMPLTNTMPPGTPPPSTPLNWKILLGGGVGCLLIGLLLWVFVLKPQSLSTPTKTQTQQQQQQPLFTQGNTPGIVLPPQPLFLDTKTNIEIREPETKLTAFAFESLTMPGFVPNLDLKLVRKPAANPVYSLVSCGVANTRYAIRWQGRYLSVVTGKVLKWSDLKEEPNSCFVLVPGYCGSPGQEYAMLRSALNGNFLRADETGTLICDDAPTANTATKFCWKLRGTPGVNTEAQCGCQYDYNVQGVVCKPCGITNTAAPATQAPLPGPWPELVGWDVQQAATYITQKHPALTILRIPCQDGQQCPIIGSPPGLVVALRYHPQTGRILFTPETERLVATPAPPIVLRV